MQEVSSQNSEVSPGGTPAPVITPPVIDPKSTDPVWVQNLGGRIYAGGAVRAHGAVFQYPQNQLRGLGRYQIVAAPTATAAAPSTPAPVDAATQPTGKQ